MSEAVAGAPGSTILCTPCAPLRTGYGLAMRAGVLLEALAGMGSVHLVVVPVAGPAGPLAWASAHARAVSVVAPDIPDHAATGPPGVPELAQWASPSLATDVPLADHVHTVVGMRTYLAPFAVALARRAGASRVVVDADDDDAALLRAIGDHDGAEEVDRLLRAWLPEVDEVWAASSAEAVALRERYDLRATREVPNAVRIPTTTAPAPAQHRLLFVGNLTYAPNRDAVRALACDVLPAVRAAIPDTTLTVVGPYDAGTLDAVAGQPGVTCTGPVPEVAPYYASADVVVVPLAHGGGTRIKLLEAAAFRRPMVASSVAVAGLELVDGRDLVVADGVSDTARAVTELLADPDRRARLAVAAAATVRCRYATPAVTATARRALAGLPPARVLERRVLWNGIEVHADEEVRQALDAVLPTAVHDFPAGSTLRYDVERTRDSGYRVLEEGDVVVHAASADAARDVVHQRFHRRVFERASRAGWLRVHGALVELGGVGVLLTGAEGAGKSTLALRLLLDGHLVHGDESVAVRGREVLAVARPIHCKPGAERAVAELAAMTLPEVGDIRILDPGRRGVPWRVGLLPLAHVVLLGPEPVDGALRLEPATHTAVLPDLVAAAFPVTESKAALLGALTEALRGVACHRLGRGAPEAMERALVAGLGYASRQSERT